MSNPTRMDHNSKERPGRKARQSTNKMKFWKRLLFWTSSSKWHQNATARLTATWTYPRVPWTHDAAQVSRQRSGNGNSAAGRRLLTSGADGSRHQTSRAIVGTTADHLAIAVIQKGVLDAACAEIMPPRALHLHQDTVLVSAGRAGAFRTINSEFLFLVALRAPGLCSSSGGRLVSLGRGIFLAISLLLLLFSAFSLLIVWWRRRSLALSGHAEEGSSHRERRCFEA